MNDLRLDGPAALVLQPIQSKARSIILPMAAAVLLAAGWKWILSLLNAFPFNSDEAVVALMARHILQGERPIFFYGQAYMGSLDAFLTAIGFLVLGQEVWVIRLIQAVLYCGVMVTTAWVAWEGYGSARAAWLAAALLVIPTVNVSLYTTVSLGGYGEALLLGNLILISAMRVANLFSATGGGRIPQNRFFTWAALLGFLSGFGLWTNGLTLVYSVPAALWVIWKYKRARNHLSLDVLLSAGGITLGMGLLGSAPWWVYAYQHGFQALFGELFGSAIAVETTTWTVRTLQHLINLILLGLPVIAGLRPPWEVRLLALPLAPFVLTIEIGLGGIVLMRTIHRRPGWETNLLLLGVVLVFCMAFLFTAFGVDPSGRYFLPLNVVFAVLGAQAIQSIPFPHPAWKVGAIGLLIAFNFSATMQCALANPPGITTQFNPETVFDHAYDPELAQFLLSRGEMRGYSDYWVSYPLAFNTSEQVIFTPRLPYHRDLTYTSRDDRYPIYDQLVAESDHVAYISTNHPTLDNALRFSFTNKGLTWQEQTIGDYLVFYHLSRRISPMELSIPSLR